jgi:hypothetical protein
MAPDQRLTPRIANIMKKKMAKERMPPSCDIDCSRVPTSVRIEGTVVRLRRGRNKRKVLRPDMLFIFGSDSRSEVITTIKSNQFQAYLR